MSTPIPIEWTAVGSVAERHGNRWRCAECKKEFLTQSAVVGHSAGAHSVRLPRRKRNRPVYRTADTSSVLALVDELQALREENRRLRGVLSVLADLAKEEISSLVNGDGDE